MFKKAHVYKYFPKYYSTEQMKEEIIELLEKERKTEKTIRLYSDRLFTFFGTDYRKFTDSCRLCDYSGAM